MTISYEHMIVEEIKSDMPDSGERMINGVLRLNGVVVQRERLRKVIHDVDPINTTLRWNARICQETIRSTWAKLYMAYWYVQN